MRHFPRPAAVCLAVVLGASAGLPATAPASDWIYTTRPGDTLWDLSAFYLIDPSFWKRLQTLNDVDDPYRMPSGKRLRFPIAWLRFLPVPARVVAVSGSAEVVHGDAHTSTAPVLDMLLYAGDEVVTGGDGHVTLLLTNGARLTLRPNSQLVLDTVSTFASAELVNSEFELKRGRSDMQAPPAAEAGSRQEIKTPAAIAGIRGTEFRVAANATGSAAQTEVLRGSVNFSAKGVTVVVPPGFGSLVKAGEAPASPVPLLPPPSLEDTPMPLDRVPIRLRVRPVPGAASYRLQIAADASFEAVLFDRVFDDTTLNGGDLADGQYVARIRAIDRRGLEGKDAEDSLIINARPEPPLPLAPPPDRPVPDGKPLFRWTEPQDASAYRFQLAADDDFTKPLIDLPSLAAVGLMPPQPLAAGSYTWHVATIDRSGDVGPFSDPQRFRVPPPGPAVDIPEPTENQLEFRWRQGMPGERYRFQLAANPDFDPLLVDRVVEQPLADSGRLDPGRYYIRIQTIEADGTEGAFGPTQTVDLQPQNWWTLLIPLLGVLLVVLL